MRVLIAPCELKGTLTAVEAASAISEGLLAADASLELDLLPLADGGPGTVEAFLSAVPAAERRSVTVQGPLGDSVVARWACAPAQRLAVVEMAQAGGLTLVSEAGRRPGQASTHGVGELILDALSLGVRSLVLGAGGSATTDGGAGMAQALGVRFLDSQEEPLPPGGAALVSLAKVDRSGLDPRLSGLAVTVATDVTSPLLGPDGAARRFAPQKGASQTEVDALEAALSNLAAVCRRDFGVDGAAELAGSGAAGGLGFGARVFLGASLAPGLDLLARWVDLDARVRRADLVITGEGRLDEQSLLGKGPWALAERCRAAGKPIVAMVGSSTLDAARAGHFEEIVEAPASTATNAREALRTRAFLWAKERFARE